MVHPIFSVLLTRPHLVIEHVSGYASLVREEASTVGIELAKRAVAYAVCFITALVFLVLAGVAAMLGAMFGEFHWALVVVPAIALVISVGAFLVARQSLPEKAFAEVKAQLDADAQALRSIGAKA